MYTLEIGGRAVAVMNGDEEEAREFFEGEEFKEDLQDLSSDGTPLWDGEAELKIRASNPEETRTFQEAVGEDSEDDEEEGLDVLFLVDIDDFEDDEEDASPDEKGGRA